MKNKEELNIIDIYNEAESKGIQDLTNSAILAFGPYYWNNSGFPTKIYSLKELWRYHDTMQDDRYLWNKKCIKNCIVGKEDLILLEKVKNKIYQFSCDFEFPYRTPGINALTRSFYQYLRIKEISNINQKEISILEVGPGCGYLGIFLALSGYKYIAIECVQAYYIYQSSLWNYIFKEKYNNGISYSKSQNIRHIVWWEFNKLNYEVPNFDILTANHVFSEMHPFALNRVLKAFQSCSNEKVIGFVDCLGHEYTSHKSILKKISEFKINIKEFYPDNYLLNKSLKKGRLKLRKFSYMRLLVSRLPFLLKTLENLKFVFKNLLNKIIKTKFFKYKQNKKSDINLDKDIDQIFNKFSNFKTPDSIYLNSSDL